MITIDTYISELVPKEWRGRAMALNQTIQFSAVPIAALLGWLLNWRWVVLFGSAGALVVWQIRRQLPESPRWSSVGRSARPCRELRRPPYAKRTVMLVIFNIFQTVGYYGFSAWVPTLLIQRGITISTSLQYTFIIAIAAPFGPILAHAIADRTERKWQIVGSALAIAVCGLLFAQMTAPALIILLGAAITLANNIMSVAFHAYQAELYPTRIRAFAVGVVYSWSRLSVVFSSFAIAFTLQSFGVIGVFTLIAGSMAIVIAAISLMGPRTTNLALEKINAA
jgi:putative MFS transporter